MDRVILFPWSLSSWRLEIMMAELGLTSNVEFVDMFEWEHLQPHHLRLSPTVSDMTSGWRCSVRYLKAAVPVLVTEEGRPLTGEDIFTFLQDQPTSHPTACVFPRGDLAASQVKKFYKKLEDVNIGVLTYGLAFHTNRSKLLRFPYCNENFYEKVLTTGAVAQIMSYKIFSFRPAITFWPVQRSWTTPLGRWETRASTSQLSSGEGRNADSWQLHPITRNLSDEHKENLPNYIEEEGYESVLKTLEKVLDYFEDELGREDREGVWLAGALMSLADVTLGKCDCVGCLSHRESS